MPVLLYVLGYVGLGIAIICYLLTDKKEREALLSLGWKMAAVAIFLTVFFYPFITIYLLGHWRH